MRYLFPALLFIITAQPASPQGGAMADATRCINEKNQNLIISYCDRALKNPDQLPLDDLVSALRARANFYRVKGQHDRAIADVTRAINAVPQPSLFSYRAALYLEKKNYDEANIRPDRGNST
jgi:tetratricopeptide (TPR) repeat protein